jgi:hypothetical protein
MPPGRVAVAIVFYSDSSDPPKSTARARQAHLRGYEADRQRGDAQGGAGGVKGEADDEARLRTLFDFVRSTIDNTSYDLAEGASSGPTKDVDNSTTADTWKRRAGTAYDINLLFIALAESLGYEARLARVSSREFGGFSRNFPDTYFLRTHNVAVKLKGAWTFCDPGYPYLPPDAALNEQGQAALIAHPKLPSWCDAGRPPDAADAARGS